MVCLDRVSYVKIRPHASLHALTRARIVCDVGMDCVRQARKARAGSRSSTPTFAPRGGSTATACPPTCPPTTAPPGQ
eukprot:194255-Prorocentrum_minimum.AAC.2